MPLMRRISIVFLVLAACATTPADPPLRVVPEGAEAVSLRGTPLVRPKLTADVQQKRETELAAARATYEKTPDDADAIIWLGRRTAYLGRYRDAIDIFTEGIRKHPRDARMYRHRGHRWISVRELDRAIADLERAASLTRGKADEVEPDGLPNARNTPIGSLQSNICYHLGLAYYLKGDFERAERVYTPCNSTSTNADRLVSLTHWRYMTYRRLGRNDEAEKILEPVSSSLDVIENAAYHKLVLMYLGEIAPEELLNADPATTDGVTTLYGIANWYLYNGQPEKAKPLFEKIVATDQWAAFAYIAAEAELARGL